MKGLSFMSNEKNGGANPLRFAFRIVQGALIGLGAVLPGISGGVLSVIFGIYKPIMESSVESYQEF